MEQIRMGAGLRVKTTARTRKHPCAPRRIQCLARPATSNRIRVNGRSQENGGGHDGQSSTRSRQRAIHRHIEKVNLRRHQYASRRVINYESLREIVHSSSTWRLKHSSHSRIPICDSRRDQRGHQQHWASNNALHNTANGSSEWYEEQGSHNDGRHDDDLHRKA